MKKLWTTFKQHYWPISALIFCPCHLPLTMAAVASLTAGTVIGGYISTYYSTIETILAVTFSFYFVLAFMIWVVRGPQKSEGTVCALDQAGQRPSGLSTKQIIVWGVIAMFIMPALIAISVFTKENLADQTVSQILAVSPGLSSGLIWLISLSTVVMIPVMVIWLVWMWLAWSKTDFSKTEPESWNYEYE